MDQTAPSTPLSALRAQLTQGNLPPDLLEKLESRVEVVEKVINSTGLNLQADQEIEYIKLIASLPFTKSTQDILDLKRASAILDKHHYGLQPVKRRILEYMSVLILNHRQGSRLHAPILAFVGLVGSGKTSLAASIAESLGRVFIRIPLGGLGSASQIRGQSRLSPDAEPGQIIKSIAKASVNNPVILLDEIDRISVEARGDVMGVLVEILDPEQNMSFVDRFVDDPFDLSNVCFIATANNTAGIATAVMDRLEIIEMPSYSDEEKIVIGKRYILPKSLHEAGLRDDIVQIDDNLWPQVVRPLGYDGGIRSLQRTIQGIIRKVARDVVEGNPGPYKLDQTNIGEYL